VKTYNKKGSNFLVLKEDVHNSSAEDERGKF